MVISHITDAKTWETDVINSQIPVFVDFYTDWCGPCKMVAPVVEDLANHYDGKVKFVKVDVDKAQELASKYNVLSIPTLVVFKDGKITSQQAGAASKESYQAMIDRALA